MKMSTCECVSGPQDDSELLKIKQYNTFICFLESLDEQGSLVINV